MFRNSDPNLPDLDFELVDDNPSQQQSNQFLTESTMNEFLTSTGSTCRIVKPTYVEKKS